MIKPIHLALVLATFSLTISPARAAEPVPIESDDPVAVDLTITAATDYRFRGVSLTSNNPVLQVDLSVTHESGVYLSFFGSNIADNGGAGLETDFGVGYSRQCGPVEVDVNAMYYLYPGVRADNYAEFSARMSTQAGSLEVGLNAAYAPSQHALGGHDNRYFSLDATLPIKNSPLSLSTSFGIEDGAFASAKRDWSLGINADLDRFTFGIMYVDTARNGGDPNAKAGVLASVAGKF